MIGTRKISLNRLALGLVPDGHREIKPIPKELLALIPKPKNKRVEVKESGCDPELDTVPWMKKRIPLGANDLKLLAPELKGSSLLATVRNDWNFVFDHIQYVKDPENIELVRDAVVTIHDRKGDCDCFTVLIGSLLMAQQIPFKIRIAAYQTPKEWEHVYLVVPDKGKEIIVDPVLHKFNYEAPLIDKKDFTMKLVSLQGTDQTGQACKTINESLIRYIDTPQVMQWGYIPTQQFLEENNIAYHQDAANDETKFIIATPIGEMSLPTIISPEVAARIKDLMSTAQNRATQAGINSKWLWLVIGGLALWALLKDPKKETGMAGPSPVEPKTKKRQAKKLATLEL